MNHRFFTPLSRALAEAASPACACAALVLAACGSAPPTPDWQMNAHDSVSRATQAYLSGQTRLAQAEWARARAEVARTARPDWLARVELMRCAAQVAALVVKPCNGFAPLRADATDADRAYADYLAGRLSPAQVALLPEPQRGAAQDPAAVARIQDPVSRLVAAGAALQAGRATPEMLVLATDTASAQGWSRAVLAWLLVRQQRANGMGDTAQTAALQRRVEVLGRQGGASAP